MQGFNLSSELFAALIGVGIALLLGALGWIINATNDTRKWKRQQRYDLYLEMVGIQRKLHFELRNMLENGQRSLDSKNLTERTEYGQKRDQHGAGAIALLAQVEEQSSIIDIVGTPKLVKRHRAYRHWTMHFIEKNTYVQLNPENEDNKYLHLWNQTHQTAWRCLLEQAQIDLGFRSRWRRSVTNKELRSLGLRKPRGFKARQSKNNKSQAD